MSLLFADSFDNYTTITDLWDSAGFDCTIRTNPALARTGNGCVQINSAAFGPGKVFGRMTHLLGCTAWFCDRAGEVMRFQNLDVGAPNVTVIVNPNGSVSFGQGNLGAIIAGPTAANLVIFNTYVSIACEVINFTANTGTINLWINGVQVFHQSGLRTAADLTSLYTNGWELMGPGGIPLCFHDDVYLLDCTSSPNNTFLGALKLYSLPPTANSSPLDWTPLALTNWQEVAEVPPNGDTSYVSSGNIGDIDQYTYPLVGPPGGSAIAFVVHELDMRLDSGSRSVSSDVGGVVNANPIALTANYHIYPFNYDVNPLTGVAWEAADFPAVFGPKVTA